MSWLLALFARWGLPQRLRAPLAWAAVLIVAVLLLAAPALLWLHFHDRGVVKQDRTAANAAFRTRQVAAERTAGAAMDARDAQDRAEQEHLKEKADEASRNGGSPADAVWGSLFD